MLNGMVKIAFLLYPRFIFIENVGSGWMDFAREGLSGQSKRYSHFV